MRTRLYGCALVLFALPSTAAPADEASSVAALEELGAKVKRDDNLPGTPVVSVNLRSTNITDDGLTELAGLKGLQTLNLQSSQRPGT